MAPLLLLQHKLHSHPSYARLHCMHGDCTVASQPVLLSTRKAAPLASCKEACSLAIQQNSNALNMHAGMMQVSLPHVGKALVIVSHGTLAASTDLYWWVQTCMHACMQKPYLTDTAACLLAWFIGSPHVRVAQFQQQPWKWPWPWYDACLLLCFALQCQPHAPKQV